MTTLQKYLAMGRASLESVAARTVTFRGKRVPALINEAGGEVGRNGMPDLSLRVGAVMEFDARYVVESPRSGEAIIDDTGRTHLVRIVGRRENVWRVTCDPDS